MSQRYALISVSDKTGVVELGRTLTELGYGIISTGSTGKTLSDAGLAVTAIDSVTGFPEVLGGRVKTLQPQIFGGILAREGLESHEADRAAHKIPLIDVVVCNLYPFSKVAAKGGEFAELVENIDIGGVSLLRAAAKNHERVLILCDPNDYNKAGEALKAKNDEWKVEARLCFKSIFTDCHLRPNDSQNLAKQVGKKRLMLKMSSRL